MKKLILFELNEVPFRIVDEFCRWRPSSCLARLLPRCSQFESYAEDRGHLSPWVTWPTVHRGVVDERHEISSFGQDLSEVDREFPPLWDILAKQGVSTGVFGSLHSYPLPEPGGNYAFYVPDTFAAGSECFPANVALFQEFNLSMVERSYRNVGRRIAWGPALRMLARGGELGFRPRTLLDMGAQLISERRQPWRRARRRTAQVMLAFDVFMKQLRRTKPAFVTFFTNHVASSMHRYWAAAFPGDYDELPLDEEWTSRFRNEIDYTMSRLDGLLARLVRFVDRHRDYQLVIATSMGQAAVQIRALKTQLYITDVKRFMHALGMPDLAWERRPAMAPDVNVRIAAEYAAKFGDALNHLTIAGKPLEHFEDRGGFFRIRLGQQDAADSAACVVLFGQEVPIQDLGMSHVEIEDGADCTAYHVPRGALLVYDPLEQSGTKERTGVSTLDLAPHILRHFGVRVPDYMSTSRLIATGSSATVTLSSGTAAARPSGGTTSAAKRAA